MLEQKIEERLNPILEDENAFLVAIELINEETGLRVDISVDTDEGIILDLCARISKRLALILEEDEVFKDPYRLELASPGLTRPIQNPRQLPRLVGKKLDILTEDESGKIVKKVFTLKKINDDSYHFLDEKKNQIEINKINIKEIKTHLDW